MELASPTSSSRPGLPDPPLPAEAGPSSPLSHRGAQGREEAEVPEAGDHGPAAGRAPRPGPARRPLASPSSGRAAHTAPRPPMPLPRTPAASPTYCLKPRPPPWPKLEANGRALRRRRHSGTDVPAAAPSERVRERADYASQDAPRDRRPAARGLVGNVVLLPGASGSRSAGAMLAFQVSSWLPGCPARSAGCPVHGPVLKFVGMALCNPYSSQKREMACPLGRLIPKVPKR